MPPSSKPLRLIFFGTSAFAVPALRALAKRHELVAVITQPDRPAGRGQKLAATPVKTEAEGLGLAVRTPQRLRDELDAIVALRPQVFVVVSYGRILPQVLLDIPPLGAFNIHPSHLPLYRGANPIAAPLCDGRMQTATSIIQMDAGMDTGDILAQEITPIGPQEVGTELHDRLAQRGAILIEEVLEAARLGTLEPLSQRGLMDEAEIQATLTAPVRMEDLLIDWHWSAERIGNVVRAYAQKPAARAWVAGERVKLLACVPSPEGVSGAAPGTVLGSDAEAMRVACGDGVVRVLKLVPPGRSPQRGAEYARRLLMEST